MENEKYITPEDLVHEHLACWFMTKGDQETRRVYQTDPVRNFCYNTAEYQQLQSRDPGIPSKKICLIDDRTNNGTTSKALGKFTPLTVQEMYLKLMEDVSDLSQTQHRLSHLFKTIAIPFTISAWSTG
jgi:hypothetical protein